MYVFDVDGTLLDCTHRLHWIDRFPKQWDTFYSYGEMMKDRPIKGMIQLAKDLQDAGHDVGIVSGRRQSTRLVTQLRLRQFGLIVPDSLTYMRRDGDRRPGHEVKRGLMKIAWTEAYEHGHEINVVFEDDPDCVRAYRDLGLTVAQLPWVDKAEMIHAREAAEGYIE